VFADLIKGSVEDFRKAVDLRALLSAVSEGNKAAIESAINWDHFFEHFDGLEEKIKDAVMEAGVKTEPALRALIERTAPSVDVRYDFNQRQPKVEAWAKEQSSKLITDIGQESRQAVRDIIQRQFAAQGDVGETARAISEVVGLNTRQATAVNNYRRSLTADG